MIEVGEIIVEEGVGLGGDREPFSMFFVGDEILSLAEHFLEQSRDLVEGAVRLDECLLTIERGYDDQHL